MDENRKQGYMRMMTDEEWLTKVSDLIDVRVAECERRILFAIEKLAQEIRDVRAQVVPVGTTMPAINGGTA